MVRCLHSDKRPGCTVLYCCTTMYVSAMCLPTSMIHPRHAMSTLYSQQPLVRHANNHAHVSEPAWPGQPIVANGTQEPRSPPSLAYFHTGPPLRSSVPCRFAFLREKASHRSPPALRADLAPLANLATVHLANAHCHRRPAPCWSSPHASSTRPRRWRLQ
jgi:hypothetical protein